MISWNLKNYIAYRIENLKKFYKSTDFWVIIIFILINTIMWGTSLSRTRKIILFFISLIIVIFLLEYKIFITGEHTRWIRDKLGIPKPSQIKELKKFKGVKMKDEKIDWEELKKKVEEWDKKLEETIEPSQVK